VVTRLDGDTVVARVDGRPMRARRSAPLAVGDAVRVLVRPAATRIVEQSTEGTVSGTVIDVAYRGRGYDHVIASTGSTLTSVFATRAWARGSAVHVALDQQGCNAYPANDLMNVTTPK
jgi:hypothetical protein